MSALNFESLMGACSGTVIYVPLLALFLFLVSHSTAAQSVDTIDNDKVITLVRAGFGDNVLIPKIRQSKVMLDVSAGALIRLKTSGVSDPVVLELMDRAKSHGFLASGPTQNYVVIEYGTEIKVLTKEKLTSKKLKVGEKLSLEIAENIMIGGKLVVSKATPVYAVVIDSRRSGMLGRSGRLAIYIESTSLTNGETLKLRAGKGGKDGDNMKSMFALSYLFGAGLLMKGTNGQLPANTILIAQVDETKYVRL